MVKTSLFGRPLNRQKVSHFTLTERVYPPFFKTPEHVHEHALFCLVLKGNYTETYGRKQRECMPATVLFHASDDPHAEHFHENGGRSFIVEINRHWIKNIREQFDFPDITANFENGNLPQLGTKLYQEFQRFDSLSPLIIEGLMMEITGETARQSIFTRKNQKPLWLKKVEDHLRERFAENLSLRQIADFVEIHPVHLAQTFRKFHRITIGNYVRQIRLESARNQLIKTSKSLTEIAYNTGFSDQSHFTRLFKREFGVPPNDYRKNFQ